MTDDEKLIRNEEKANIILKLIGRIDSVGETNFDRAVKENLNFVDDFILFPLIEDLLNNATYEGYEGSRLDIKEKSLLIIKKYYDYILDILEDLK